MTRTGSKRSEKSSPGIKFILCMNEFGNKIYKLDDIKKAKELGNKNIEGIIVGKAIYDADIKLDELAKEIDA